ncbi:hypothetical protein SAY87_003210 [Trapa incisa]|uniref:DEK-C domain-containing protein n=1 Tax=Trapa incisa TaxID=236973 RepID=A0AAN7KIS7_9MYRT|nr:hypothetical protein SAY87_003210 [Trapa incisa]
MASDHPGDVKPSEDHQEEQEQAQEPAPAHREAVEEPPKQQQPLEEGEGGANGDHKDSDAEGEAADEEDEPKQSAPKKRKRGRKSAGKSQTSTPATDRPTRERKVVERYSSSPAYGRTPGSKPLSIVKGSGTQLKDIPNVAFKLSKQKSDDSLQALHSVLFGRKAKAHSLKRNIGQFSGFVWDDNEEKQRSKVKEKLERCVKEKLVYFCDVLNIPMNKATTKKEELSAKILEFLESPHTTTDALLSEKGQKRKRRSSSSKSIEATEMKQKKKGKVGEKQKSPSAAEEDNRAEESMTHSDIGDDSSEDNEKDNFSKQEVPQIGNTAEENMEGEVDVKDNTLDKDAAKEEKVGDSVNSSKPGRKKGATKSSKSPSSPGKKPSSLKKKSDSKTGEKGGEKSAKENSSSKKRLSKPSVVSTKDQGKSETIKKAKAGPSREEIHEEVVKILKEVDFNTATLSDILKRLGTHFDVDLYSRKAEVKAIIAEVLNAMSDDEGEGEEDEDANNDNDSEDEDN